MIVKQALAKARDILIENNIDDVSLEGELLLRHALGIDRVQLYIDLEKEITPHQEEIFFNLLERRIQGEPAAYITGRREFYGLDLAVNPAVLIPRPESELLVEKALSIANNHPLATIADIGTGSGAIAVSLAVSLPQTLIYATDISAAALKTASANCSKHGVADRVRLLEGNLLEPLPEPVDLIVANLPYVSRLELKPGLEPSLALDGGADGTRVIERLCRQAGGRLKAGGYLLLEIGQGQREAVTAILHNILPASRIDVFPDLAGIDRAVLLSLAAGAVRLDRQPLHC